MLKKSKSNPKHWAFGLLEVMISAMVLSISLLGVAAMQSRVVSITLETDRRDTASRMARQLINYMHAAASGQTATQQPLFKFVTSTPALSSKSCSPSAPCTIEEYYEHFITDWQASVSSILPDGASCICVVSNNSTKAPPSIELRVAIRWKQLSGVYEYVHLDPKLYTYFTNSSVKACSLPSSHGNTTGCTF